MHVQPYSFLYSAAAVVGLCWPLSANAEPGKPSKFLRGLDDYAGAVAAFDDRLYDLAASRFSDLLASPVAANFTTADEDWITQQVAIAHVRADQPSEALRALRNLEDLPEPAFWRGQALMQLGRFAEAEQLFKSLLSGSALVHPDACHFARARALSELGRLPEVVPELETAMDSTDRAVAARARVALAETLLKLGTNSESVEAIFDATIDQPYQSQLRYIVGLAQVRDGNPKKALRTFKDVLKLRETLPATLVTASEIGLATALAGNGQEKMAAQQLVATIERTSHGPLLFEAFSALEALKLFSTPGMPARLKEWGQSDNAARATPARYYSIVAQEESGLQTDTLSQYAAFTIEHSDHPLVAQALLRQAVLLARSARPDAKNEALGVLEQLRTHAIPEATKELVEFLQAKAEFAIANSSSGSISAENQAFAAERFRIAELAFLAVTASDDPKTAAAAHYDAAIAAMRADSTENLAGYLSALESTPDLRGDLLIERGLYLAANQQYRDARLALETFVAFSPGHSRAFHAHLALAEIAMLEFPPRIRAAQRHLTDAREQPKLTDLQKQQVDYTEFWLEESKRGEELAPMVELGNRFLEKWPDSPWQDAVRMKLGEHYFRLEDYPLALTMFESLERESPNSELAEAALYFAAKANMRLNPKEGPNRAIEMWSRIVRNGGQLSIPARYQWAIVYHRQGKTDEAIAILRELLNNEDVAGEERKAILCSLGETLFSQGTRAPDKMQEAERIFADVVAMSDDAPRWRNQALYRLAKCHESANNLLQAKEAYYRVFETKTTPVPDFRWFERAGFQLVELLKQENEWDAAISVATKIEESNGPRARQAKQIADQLKLDHFRL